MYKSNISSIYQDISYYLYIRNKRKTTEPVRVAPLDPKSSASASSAIAAYKLKEGLCPSDNT